MKKTNTRCKLSLFIWLLSFNTLSSCVNTGQSLGIGLCQSKLSRQTNQVKRQLDEHFKEQLNNKNSINNPHPYQLVADPKTQYCGRWDMKKYMPYIATALGTTIIGGCMAYYLYSAPSELSSMEEANNNTKLTATGNGTANFVDRTISSVGTTAAVVATTAAGLIIPKLKPNHSTSTVGPSSNEKENGILDAIYNSKWHKPSTTQASDTKPPYLSNYQEAISHIQKNGFSIQSIQDYLDNGFGINQGDPINNITPLTAAVNHKKYEATEYLLKHGANPNAQDNKGRGVLMYIKDKDPESERIFDELIKYGANPCIKNKKGELIKPNPDANQRQVELLLKEQKKKC